MFELTQEDREALVERFTHPRGAIQTAMTVALTLARLTDKTLKETLEVFDEAQEHVQEVFRSL